ncbi:MAG: hypothetical protein ACYDGR_17730 [Candidatus Dormibacteria bacterium]
MRRLGFVLLTVMLVGACSSKHGTGAFSGIGASPASPPQAPASLDSAALMRVRQQLSVALAGHLADGHLPATWGVGATAIPSGPYRAEPGTLDALGLLSAVARSDAGASAALRQSVVQELHELDGPEGAALLLTMRALRIRSAESDPCAGQGSDPISCQAKVAADGLMKAWYAQDTRSFFELGESSTLYRPVEAFGVGAALVVEGYREHAYDKIGAGTDIIQKEMTSDFDGHFHLAYGLMTATASGGRQPADYGARPADQAGIAELLLLAFDASRDTIFKSDADQVLQPLLDYDSQLRPTGYVASVDLRGDGAPRGPQDVEAGYLVLGAAHHYDVDDGNHLARLEEAGAAAVLATAGSDVTGGLPVLVGGQPRSGLVTAVAYLVLDGVLGQRP